MIITCPNCSTRFRLNADLLGDAGRNVKCAKCAHRWFADPSQLSSEPDRTAKPAEAAPAPPPPAPPPPAPPPPAPPPVEENEEAPSDEAETATEEFEEEDEFISSPPIPSEEEIAQFQAKPPETKSILKWWVLLLVVIVVLVGTVFSLPRYIVALYPPSNKLYMLVGMGGDVLGSGLEIPDYKIESRLDGKDRIVLIKGEIKNTTDHVMDVPLIRGSVRNAKEKELYVWWFKTKEPRVLGGESVLYETEIRNPPRGGVNVSVTFTQESEMEAEKARVKGARAKKK